MAVYIDVTRSGTAPVVQTNAAPCEPPYDDYECPPWACIGGW